jgi:PAS domain S-box-containing protein
MNDSRSKPVLLIADANTENIDEIQEMLTHEYDIKITHSGVDAIRLASSQAPPGLILLNISLESVDAYELCKTLKGDRTTGDIPIIFIAEPTPDDTEAKGFEVGAADYITRPFKKSVVRARIRTQLELKRCRENLDKRVKTRIGELHDEIQERRDVEDTYRALVEHARDGIAIIQDFKVRYANPAFCKMLGLAEQELIGAHLKKFLSEEEFIENTKRYSGRISGLNLPRIYKSQVIHSSGSSIDVELNVCVVPYGRSLAALVFVRDLREEQAWEYFI